MRLPSRIVHLPLSWDDPATQLATRRYQQSVRADAPWCPDNIEFIRRINGLESRDAVRDIVFDASYLVMGLGDVYLGAPVATPLDPRHRLVTTKYNPARTWTPENAVGIGGAYLCVYGMEGPGRLPVRRAHRADVESLPRHAGLPRRQAVAAALLRPDPLLSGERRRTAAHARGLSVRRIPCASRSRQLDLGEYLAFLERERDSIDTFRGRQRAGLRRRARALARRGRFARRPSVEAPVKAAAPAAAR